MTEEHAYKSPYRLKDLQDPFKMPYWYRRGLGLALSLIALVLEQGSRKWNMRVELFFWRWRFKLLVWEIITWKYLSAPTAWWLVYPKIKNLRAPLKGKLFYSASWKGGGHDG